MRIRTLGALASLGALLTGTQTTPDASPQPVPTPAALTERQTEEHARVVQAVPLVAPEPEPFKPLFNGQNLEGWQPPKAHPDRFVATDGVLRIIGKSAWLLTSQAYDDFVLTFEARPVGPDSVGGILVRTLILPKHRLAYEVQVANGQKASAVLLQHADDSVLPGLDPPPTLVSADGEWHRYRVECVEDRISLSRDDAAVLKETGLLLTTGPIAVHAASGIVELRNVRMQLIAPRRLTLRHGLARSDGPAVTPSKRRPEWRPRRLMCHWRTVLAWRAGSISNALSVPVAGSSSAWSRAGCSAHWTKRWSGRSCAGGSSQRPVRASPFHAS